MALIAFIIFNGSLVFQADSPDHSFVINDFLQNLTRIEIMFTPQLNGHSVTTIAESTVYSEHCKYSRALLSDYVVGP